jgi:hypothetical protein
LLAYLLQRICQEVGFKYRAQQESYPCQR